MLKRWITHILGVIIVSMGVALLISQNKGAQAWDAASLNLGLKIDVGLAAFILNIFVCLICIIWTRKLKYLLVLANAFAFSLILTPLKDLFLLLPNEGFVSYIWLFLGIITIAIGINFLVLAKLIPMPAEALFVLIHEHLIKHYMMAKIALEIAFAIVAVILGSILGTPFANLSLFTVIATVGISLVIHVTNKPLKSIYERITPNEN